jgi:hypothetical protein
MFQLINEILQEFRYCFKRKKAWQWFIILIYGFMIRKSHRGLTQIISSLRLKPEQYHTMLHFFRSKAYKPIRLYEKWIQISQRYTPYMKISNRTVFLGDHIKISKEGRRMPDVRLLRQESQNSGKGEYIEGHIHAHVSALISGGGVTRSLPLITEQQQSPPKKEGTKETEGETLVTQMVNLVSKAVKAFDDDEKAVAALDAYFSKSSAFLAADKCLDEDGQRRLEIVTRGRDDTVGYMLPEPRPAGKRGAARKYGDRIVLRDLFSNLKYFTRTTLTIYGKPANVKYLCMDLIWKPLGRMIRFVAVDSDRGRMILMCSDLTLDPESIITIYALRFKIETSFDEQKNENGSFSYRFWTKALQKRKRWAKNEHLPQPEPPLAVTDAKRAIESFLCLGVIATGIMTIIGFSYNLHIWKRYSGWIKTRRTDIPSIAVIKDVIAQDFPVFLTRYPYLFMTSFINERRRVLQLWDDDVA